MDEKKNVGAIDYFHRRIDDFDDIYRDDKGGLLSFLNRTIRASVRIRFELAFEILNDLTGKSVLDIGTGSGRYMFEALRHNAERVVGLDAASGAIEKAKELAKQFGVEDKLEFHIAEYLDFNTTDKYDAIFAVGYFDYIFNPAEHLKKMMEMSSGIIYASFPKRWSVLSAIRKIRLSVINKCPVRYYSKRNIEKLMREIGCDNYKINKIFRDNILIIDNS